MPCTWVLPAAGGFALEAGDAGGLCHYGTSLALSCGMRMLAQMCCMLIMSAGNALLHKAGVPCTLVLPAAGGFALGAEDARGCVWHSIAMYVDV